MESLETFTLTIHIITCFLLILVVLLQSGKGAEVSASFGGSSQTVFGSSGGANFFTKLTATLAGIFMFTSITMTILGTKSSVMDQDGGAKKQTEAPASTEKKDSPPADPGSNLGVDASKSEPSK